MWPSSGVAFISLGKEISKESGALGAAMRDVVKAKTSSRKFNARAIFSPDGILLPPETCAHADLHHPTAEVQRWNGHRSLNACCGIVGVRTSGYGVAAG